MIDLICYFDRLFGWVLYAVDQNGNQLWDAQYFPNKEKLKAELCL
jgi:hypothetical protein